MRFFRQMLALILLPLSALTSSPSYAQQGPAPTVFRVDTSLVLVDVMAENTKTGLHTRALLTDLKRDDFRVFDNGREMPISSFDSGAVQTSRPIALWLIVQCNMGFPVEWASMFLQGKTQYLAPALKHLGANDVVGVAHWCDDGKATIDLDAGHDPAVALAKVEEVLNEGVHHGANRPGELAMQHMVRTVLDTTHRMDPPRLPVLLFLLGDHNGTMKIEADKILEDLLEDSSVVFGLNDNGYPYRIDHDPPSGKIFNLVHYYSSETGGQFYSTSHPELFSDALDYIEAQLHARYTLGFEPAMRDGKRHQLKVELTAEAKTRFPAAELRFRPEYVAPRAAR